MCYYIFAITNPFTVLLVHYPCTHNSMTVTHVDNNSKVTSKLSNTIYTYKNLIRDVEITSEIRFNKAIITHVNITLAN